MWRMITAISLEAFAAISSIIAGIVVMLVWLVRDTFALGQTGTDGGHLFQNTFPALA
jgi:hypothetical protein